MENKNLIWIVLGLVVVGILIFVATKPKKNSTQGTQNPQTPQSSTGSKDGSNTTANPYSSGGASVSVARYYADAPTVNLAVMDLQKAINAQTTGANPFRLSALVADGKLGDRTAAEIAKIDATIGASVKANRYITPAQITTIFSKLTR
jgi:hypothetical protein